jgi:outer membrane immunogenic protein
MLFYFKELLSSITVGFYVMKLLILAILALITISESAFAADLLQRPVQGRSVSGGVYGAGGAKGTGGCDPRTENCSNPPGCDPTQQNCTTPPTGCDPATQKCEPADVAIKKTGGTSPHPYIPNYVFRLFISNTGLPFSAPAGAFVVTDVVPAGMSFTSVTAPPGWTCTPPTPIASGGLLTCVFSGGPVPSGPLGTIVIGALMAGPGPFPPVTNCSALTVLASSGVVDTDSSNNSSCATVVKGPLPGTSRQPGQNQNPNQTILPPNEVPSRSWDGFYVGAVAGASQTTRNTFGSYQETILTSFNASKKSNFLFGGFIMGYSIQTGPAVLGIEADLEISGLSKSQFIPAGRSSYSSDARGSLRARVGYAVNTTHFYLTGGVAGADLHASFVRPSGALASTSKGIQFGYTLGGGIEQIIDRNWRARIEYRHTNFGSINSAANPAMIAVKNRITDNSIRLGLTYRFGN